MNWRSLFTRSATWDGPHDLRQQLNEIERAAKRNGSSSVRRPVMTAERVREVESRLTQSLPDDLRTVVEWYDPAIWSWFVNPQQCRKSDNLVITAQGERITRDHPADRVLDPIILDPEGLKIESVRTSDDDYLRRVRQDVAPQGKRDPSWLDAQFIPIGHGDYFQTIYYTVRSPQWPTGSIVIGIEDSFHLYWMAHSLANWMCRLIVCGGEEFALGLDPAQKITAHHRAFFKDWATNNPGCSRWTGR